MLIFFFLSLFSEKRNSLGPDRLFVGRKNQLFSFFNELYDTDALDLVSNTWKWNIQGVPKKSAPWNDF